MDNDRILFKLGRAVLEHLYKEYAQVPSLDYDPGDVFLIVTHYTSTLGLIVKATQHYEIIDFGLSCCSIFFFYFFLIPKTKLFKKNKSWQLDKPTVVLHFSF